MIERRRNELSAVASLIWPSCDRKIDDVEPAEDARQDGPQDRPVPLPGTDHGDHHARDPETVTGWMGPFYEGKEQLQRDEAMRSCGIAGQTIMLAAKAMGYDSCPMIGFDQVKVAEIINLPSDHVIGFMIAVGKAVKPAMPKGGQLGLSEVVVQDRFA